MAPSIKTIESELRVDHERAVQLHNLITGKLDPLTFVKAARYERQCYSLPSKAMLILYAADEILETCGVEGMTLGSDEHAYSYCNTGDTYAATLVYDHDNHAFLISSWGDIAEEQSKDNHEETLDYIRDEGHGMVRDGAPKDWPSRVFRWLWDNEQEELEEGPNFEAATPSSDAIRRALQDLGLLEPDEDDAPGGKRRKAPAPRKRRHATSKLSKRIARTRRTAKRGSGLAALVTSLNGMLK